MKPFSTNRIFFFSLVILSLIAGLAFTPANAPAAYQETTPTETPMAPMQQPTYPPVTLRSGNDVVMFSQVSQPDFVMRGPYASARIRFGVPVDWKLSPGAELQLVINHTFTSTRQTLSGAPLYNYGNTLQVSFNGKIIEIIPLGWTGLLTVVVPIPEEALVSTRDDRRHDLVLFLDAAEDCLFDESTSVVISSESRFYLPHQTVTPEMNFNFLPYPLYQSGQFLTLDQLAAQNAGLPLEPSAVLVVPNQPTAGEMQAALTTSAAFGKMSNNNLTSMVVSEGSLNDDLRASKDLIYVGKATSFSSLASLSLPSPANGESFAAAGSPDDGILQMIPSPWNSSRTVMVVSGGNEQAVVKGAQALSSFTFLTSGRPDLVVVEKVQPEQTAGEVPVDRTFRNLGYGPITLSGLGLVSADVRFFIPPGQGTNDEAYALIQFANSANINFNGSTLNVFINNLPVGGSRLELTDTSTSTLRVKIPPYSLKPNINILTIEAELFPLDGCWNYTSRQLWMSVSPDSLLHIPLSATSVSRNQFFNLAAYPYSLADHPSMKETSFVLAPNDPVALSAAASIASDLGRRMTGGLAEFSAYYADAVPDSARTENNLVIVGRASAIPLMQDLKDSLPAAFPPGSDVPAIEKLRVVFRLPANTSLGYLQLLTNPWNSNRTILTVGGSNEEGLNWASQGITLAQMRGQLAGNFAVVKEKEILTADTRSGVISGELPSSEPLSAVEQIQSAPASPSESVTGFARFSVSKDWIPPVLAGSLFLILLMIVVGIVSSRARKGTQ